MELYRDPSKSVEKRVKDLVSRMTLDEKLAELGGVWSYELMEGKRFSTAKAKKLLKNGIGHLCRPGVSTGLPPLEMAEFINGVQRFLIENTRLGIPAMVHEECLNGFMAKGAIMFPQIIGMASTWEPELVGKMASVARSQMLAVGVRQGLSPVLDVIRDPRWGRVEETYGEDPYLVAAMGLEYVKGLQGDDPKQGIAATLKHFCGYGKSEGGLNWAPADIPTRMLREVYLYPFEKAVKEGGALSVMNAYQEIDGVPCAASEELLTKILRQEWGFQGTVVSDYFAVDMLRDYHKVASDKAGAARLALTAGVDVELPNADCYASPLKEQVEKGTVAEKLLDRAVSRTLRLKFLLGLFKNPYVEAKEAAKVFALPEHRQLALESARKSIVLLKNKDNLLPLRKDIKTIAVLGPNADSRRNLLGDYTYPPHMDITIMAAQAIGAPLPAVDEQADHVTVPVVTIVEGIKARVSASTKVIYAAGCEYNCVSKDGFPEAIEAAGEANVVVMVMGGKSGLMPDCTCGETRDRAELCLLGVQEELVKAVYETGTPVVLVIVDGRPLVLGSMAAEIPAIIEAWLPGVEGGDAVADVLFGDYNPGGKLPISFPVAVGQLPVYYGHKPSGGRSQFWGDYVDASSQPLYEFGYGLSYTSFELSNLQLEPKKVKPNGKIAVKAEVKNTGDRAGEEVVQLYVNDVVASLTRPVKELRGFRRIALAPGEKKTVEFELPVRILAFYDKSMKLMVEPGVFKVMVGRSSKDIVLEGEFEVLA